MWSARLEVAESFRLGSALLGVPLGLRMRGGV